MNNVVIMVFLALYYTLVQLKLTRIEEKIDRLNRTDDDKG